MCKCIYSDLGHSLRCFSCAGATGLDRNAGVHTLGDSRPTSL
jgi:hypothetical protein